MGRTGVGYGEGILAEVGKEEVAGSSQQLVWFAGCGLGGILVYGYCIGQTGRV